MSFPKTFEPCAVRQHRIFETTDLNQASASIAAVLQTDRLTLIGRGSSLTSHMDFIRFGGIGIGTLKFGDAVRMEADENSDYYHLIFCLEGRAGVILNGQDITISQTHGLIRLPKDPVAIQVSSDCEQFFMRIDRQTMAAHTGIEQVLFRPHVKLGDIALRPWLDQLRAIATSPALLRCASTNEIVAVQMERLMIRLLLAGQRTYGSPSETFLGLAPKCVRKAEFFMEEHAGEGIRLQDVAGAADVSVRTLLEGFRRFRNISPMQYLRDLRLDLTRDRLVDPGEGASVASIALECGFLHHGRFAQAYQQRFGESPSETLRKAC